jgi:4'-phosphopantetheinyl transferase
MRVRIQECPTRVVPGPPDADEVHVWRLDFERPPWSLADLATVLTPDERDRADRYRAGQVREQFVLSRGVLRKLLGRYLETPPNAVPITYAPAGKPVLAGGSLHFNVTHTSGLALVAVARCRVGVDVERVRDVPDMAGLVERFFSAVERQTFRQMPSEKRTPAFYRGWVCKEAVIKAAGASMQYLDGFDVELDPARSAAVLAVRHAALASSGWVVADWEPSPGFAAAVAIEGRGEMRIE